ncbi:MAG: M23 family metallopeptidase [Methylobacteriaceae bacterium]|nr:M23 family metallopeptidase [Methylobacteriaceae bacterium]
MRSPFSIGGHQPLRAVAVALGDEPPIEADGGRRSEDDHRRISIHWLAGTILTGLSGAGLIGAAAYSALDRQTYQAETPQAAQVVRKEDRGDAGVNPRKGDRLVKAVDIVAAKQSFKAPVAVRAGDREIIRTLTFTRVATSLTLAETGLADEVPAFNPLRLLASARGDAVAAPEESEARIDDAEVAFVMRDLSAERIDAQPAQLSLEEAQAQVNEYLKTVAASGARAPIQLPAQMLLMRTSRVAGPGLAYANVGEPVVSSTPFSSIEVKMVPENVTLISKSPPPADKQPTQMDERLVVVRHGETLQDVLRANSIGKQQAAEIVAALGGRKADSIASEGRRIKLLFADLDGSGKNMTLARVTVHSDDRIEATVAITDEGHYVQVERAVQTAAPARKGKRGDDDDEDESGMRLYDSLYQTALKQEMPKQIISDLIRVFANDVDFQRAVQPGDAFEVFYDDSEERDDREKLLYASITARDETFKYYRFRTPDDGLVDYYDENGRSTRKFLIRQPIAAARITSGFGVRYHPILGYSKMHTGVDFAAPIGTPIFASGNGTVLTAGWHSGYGRRVEIQHANGYVTAYNHLSGFARGMTEGVRVRQGQVIGYLGSSGLSTGPHLHYEVMVNSHFVDPMRVKLARTREMDGKMLAEFKRERDRIDSIRAKAPNATRVAARSASN